MNLKTISTLATLVATGATAFASVDTAQVVSASTANAVSNLTGSALGDMLTQLSAVVINICLAVFAHKKAKSHGKATQTT